AKPHIRAVTIPQVRQPRLQHRVSTRALNVAIVVFTHPVEPDVDGSETRLVQRANAFAQANAGGSDVRINAPVACDAHHLGEIGMQEGLTTVEATVPDPGGACVLEQTSNDLNR